MKARGRRSPFTISSARRVGVARHPVLATAKSVTTTISDDDDAPTGIVLSSASPSSLGEDDGGHLGHRDRYAEREAPCRRTTTVTIGTLAREAPPKTPTTPPPRCPQSPSRPTRLAARGH